MRKETLILIPFVVGLLLIFYSWYVSYPIAINTPSDFLFYHISPFFWLGLSIELSTLYLMAIVFKRNSLKFIATLGIVTLIYSMAYFYWFLPGPDSTYFRGLTEYFVETGNLNPSTAYHSYYQWPIFFLLNKIAYSLGLNLRIFEFVSFGFFTILYGTSLYSIFNKSSKDGASLAVISYFIIMYWYLDYQFVPFSLAIGLLFVLLMLDSYKHKTPTVLVTMLIIFACMTFVHAFVPTFFILYAFIKYIVTKERKYKTLFLITLIMYFFVLMFQAIFFFPTAVEQLFTFQSSEYERFSRSIFVETPVPLDELAQTIGRGVFITIATATGIGFIVLLLKRKLGSTNFSIFISGALYALASAILPILGVRAFAIVGVPLSLGVTYFQKSKFKRYFQGLFFILIILFVFVPIHSSYSLTRTHLQYQTEENYQCTNFWIDFYHPDERSLMGTDFRTAWYLVTKYRSPNVTFGAGISSIFDNDINDYDCMLYTIGLEKDFLRHNYTAESITQEINKYSIVYNSGSSCILVREKK